MGTKRKIVAILGTTAAGKSGWALDLAKEFGGFLVSADSRQIYRGMDIGTNKELGRALTGGREVEGVPYLMFDAVNPDDDFSLAQYKKMAESMIDCREGVPIIVGGTGLYVQALVDNFCPPEVAPDWEFRKVSEREIKDKGMGEVWDRLLRLDPGAEGMVDSRNPRRVVRALEVCQATGKPFSQLVKKGAPKYEALQIGIQVDDLELRRRIDQRVEEMIKEGLVGEVKKLVEAGYGFDLPSMSGIGYREIGQFLAGQISLVEAAEEIKKNTWQYARRQKTWFRKDKRIVWLTDFDEAKEKIKKFLG